MKAVDTVAGWAYITFLSTPGQTYKLSYEVEAETTTSTEINLGTSIGSSSYFSHTIADGNQSSLLFTATTSLGYFSFGRGTLGSSYINNIRLTVSG